MLISKARRDGNYTDNPILPKIDTPANAIFQITDTKQSCMIQLSLWLQKMTRNF